MPTLMEAHLADGALIRLLDGEADASEREHGEAHLTQCAECQARHERLERRSARLSELLLEADYALPAPPTAATDEFTSWRAARQASATRPQHAWLAAAAAVVLLLGIGFAASPARAWAVGWIGERWAEVARLWTSSEAPESADPAPPAAATRIDFTARGSDFSLSFAAPQHAGGVSFTLGEGEGASIEVHATGPAPDVLVLPDGVRIQNTAATAAEYRITLPTHTRRVQLQVGAAAPVWLSIEALREQVRMGLVDGTEAR